MSAEPAFEQSQWAFDERVTDQFDEMLSRSVPLHDLMRRACFDVGRQHVETGGVGAEVVDLGCSRGEAVKLFLDNYGAVLRYEMIEASRPMFDATCSRYRSWIDSGVMRVWNKDLREFYPQVASASLTLSVLTLMFTPIEHRQRLVRKVFKTTRPGGAFILVEKVLGSTAEIDGEFQIAYRELKKANGYSTEEIERKRLALEGKLVPVTAHWNEELLKSAGFQHVDCFWRWCNFAAWIAIKE